MRGVLASRHHGITHLRLGADGSRICTECPALVCQPPAPGGAQRNAVDEDELARLIGRAQQLLRDWRAIEG
jgi:hypothetical protein